MIFFRKNIFSGCTGSNENPDIDAYKRRQLSESIGVYISQKLGLMEMTWNC